jgi:hypothetical protein
MAGNIVPYTPIVKNDERTIEELACSIRDNLQQVRKSVGLTLDRAMAAGDDLIAVQPKVVVERGLTWKKWLKENCLVAVSTAELYMQLARHRDEIEAQLLRGVTLSLNAARKLISSKDADEDDQSRGGASSTSTPPSTTSAIVAAWNSNAPTRTVSLDEITAAGIRSAASPSFLADLRAELPVPKLYDTDPVTIAAVIFETLGPAKADRIRQQLEKLLHPNANGKSGGKPFKKRVNLPADQFVRH